MSMNNDKTPEKKTPTNYSKAEYSNITTPEEDNKKRSMAESIISDLANQRNEIDSIKEMLKLLLDQQNQLATMVNQITTAINNPGQQGTTNPTLPNQGLNIESLEAIGNVAEKVMSVWKSYKGSDNITPLISQDTLNKEMTDAFFDNLNTGKSINKFVKDSLQRNVTKKVIKGAFESIGHDEHAPQ